MITVARDDARHHGRAFQSASSGMAGPNKSGHDVLSGARITGRN